MACPFFVEIQEWMAVALGQVFIEIGLQKFAYIRPMDIINSLSTEQTVEEAKILNLTFQVQGFLNKDDARSWILAK